MKQKILFIINPVAGIKRKDVIPVYIQKYLDHNKYEYDIQYTESRGHATEIACNAAKGDVDIVAVAGGDGSVNEAATGLINTNTKLAILPAGSGNGLARNLGYSMRKISSIEIINDGWFKKIDVCKVNEHYFFSLIGIGLDAFIAKVFDKEETRGFLTYAISAIKGGFNYVPFDYVMKADDKEIRGTSFMINICNSNQYGYNVKISPLSLLDDGEADIIIANQVNAAKKILLMGAVLTGTHLKNRHIQHIKAKRIKIETSRHAYLQVDGETVHKDKDFLITIQPRALNVLYNKSIKS